MNKIVQAYCDEIVPGKIKYYDYQCNGPLARSCLFEWLPAREFGVKLPILINERVDEESYKEICDEVIRLFQQWQTAKEKDSKEK